MGGHAEQTTIARPVTKRGLGLHTGADCAVTLRPAEPNAGIAFVTESGATITAVAENVVDTRRGTSLGANGATVGCIEHLMAALYGLGIGNARIAVNGPEVPACDGSALEWVELIREAGMVGQGSRPVPRVRMTVWAGDEFGSVAAVPGGPGLSLGVGVDYEGTVARHQSVWLRLTPQRFAEALAPARTFVMDRELAGLQEAGLARGGSERNAFVVGPTGYSGPLRFEDEVVRHKALDLVGDLALCGWGFAGVVVAVRPSHRMNVALARALRSHLASALAQQEAVRRG